MKLLDIKDRYQIEERYHDVKAQNEVHDFYSFGALQLANEFLWRSLGNLQGKRVLEIGCGDGTATLRFAQAGACVTAIDISSGMVELTKKKADSNGYANNVKAIYMKGEDIDFEAESFDVIYGHSVLHHMDLEKFAPACARVLHKDGIACFLEPLDYNPIINLFRKLTPTRRTPTEKPLRMYQISEMAKYFDAWEHEEFILLSLVSFLWYYGIKNEKLFRGTMRMFSYIDKILFRTIPSLRHLAWVTVLRFKK